MAAADGDDSLYPIAVLIDELRNEDVQVRRLPGTPGTGRATLEESALSVRWGVAEGGAAANPRAALIGAAPGIR